MNKIKNILSSSPVLSFFDTSKDVQIQVDASSHGLGACIIQEGHPISYTSCSLTTAEQRYAQIEKELLAIVFACERFNQYTYGRQVTIQSDHKPLEYILNNRIQRLLIKLQKYQILVKYVPRKDLHIADSLSRAHLNNLEEDENLNEDCNVMVHTLLQNLPISTDRLKQLQHDTKLDPVLPKITNYITHGWPHNQQMLCHEEKQ